MIKYEKGRPVTVATLDEELNLIKQAWKSMTSEQKKFILKVMEAKSDDTYDELMNSLFQTHYIREPVDIDTFLDDPYYSGPGGSAVYPKLREDLRKIFAGKYSEVIMTGCVDLDAKIMIANGSLRSIRQLLDSGSNPVVTIPTADPRSCNPSHSGVQSVVEVKMSDGSSLKLTPDHRVQCLDVDRLVWVEAKDLSVGQPVLSVRHWETRPDRYISDSYGLVAGILSGYSLDKTVDGDYVVLIDDAHAFSRFHASMDILELSFSVIGFDRKSGSKLVCIKPPVFDEIMAATGCSSFEDFKSQVPDAIMRSPSHVLSQYLYEVYSSNLVVHRHGLLGSRKFVTVEVKAARSFVESLQYALKIFGVMSRLDGETLIIEGEDIRRADPVIDCWVACRFLDVYDQPPPFYFEHRGDVFLTVVSVDSCDQQIEVGDLSVLTDHRFVCSNMCVHNSIGWGKSYLSSYGIMYSMYLLSCLREPAQTYGIAGDSKIIYALMSVTKEHCKDSLWEESLKPKLEISPYFRELGTKCLTYKAKVMDGVTIVVDSTAGSYLIGKNVFGGIADEVNFGIAQKRLKAQTTVNSKQRTQSVIAKTYESIVRRMKSRFMRHGSLPGILFVVSSSNNEEDFTTQRISQSLDDPSVYVMSYSEWETKPPSKYSGETFRVFFGGSSMSSKILENDEDPPIHDEDDHAKVIDVPVEFFSDFDSDIEGAIRDIAGVSVPRIMPFISNWKAIERTRSRRKEEESPTKNFYWYSGDPSPFKWNIMCSRTQEMNFNVLEDTFQPLKNPDAPRHIHIDPSLKHDVMGFSMGHVDKMVEVVMRDKDTGDLYKELRPSIWFDVLLAIKAPPDSEILFRNVRRLVYELQAHGYMITYASLDSFNSADTIQQFRNRGIQSEVLSVDSGMRGYQSLKEAIYQDRIHIYDYEYVIEELKYLQVDNVKRKVDHLPDRTKDVADSMAGVVQSLTEKNVGTGAMILPSSESDRPVHPLDHWSNVGGNGFEGNATDGPQYRDLPPWLSGD